QHVRGQRIVWIITFGLASRINTRKLERVELARSFHFHPPNNPHKLLVRGLGFVQAARELAAILTRDGGNPVRGRLYILYFAGIAVEGFGIEAARQFPTLTVEHLPASGSCFN